MTNNRVELELFLTAEPVAPDTIDDIEALIRTVALGPQDESTGIEGTITLSLERRAPIPPNAIEIVAALKLIFKDVPDTISGIKKFVTSLKERLKRANIVQVTAEINGQKIVIKSPNEMEWKVELGENFKMIYKPQNK